MTSAHLSHVATFGLASERRPFDATGVDGLASDLHSQKMSGLGLAAALTGDLVVDDAQLDAIAGFHQSFVAVELELDALALRLIDRLGGTGLVVLKGVAHAHTEYPDPAWRQYGDLDVFAAPDRVDEVIAELEKRGFSRTFEPFAPAWEREFGKSITLTDGRLEMDIHRNLSQGLALGIRPPDVLAHRTTATIGSIEVPVLAPDARFVHAAVHALGGSRTPPLNGLVDLAWMASDADRMRSGLALAREWGVPGTFAAALRAVERELGAHAIGDEQLDMVAGVRPTVREGLAGRALSRSQRTFRHDVVAGMLSLRSTSDRVRYLRGLATARRARP